MGNGTPVGRPCEDMQYELGIRVGVYLSASKVDPRHYRYVLVYTYQPVKEDHTN